MDMPVAAATGMSQSAVSRIRRPFGLKSHLVQTGKSGTDLQFAELANRKLPRSAHRSVTSSKPTSASGPPNGTSAPAIRLAKAAGEILKLAGSLLSTNWRAETLVIFFQKPC